MMDNVLLSSPFTSVLLLLALTAAAISFFLRSGGKGLCFVSLFLVSAACAAGLILGAEPAECGTACLGFFIVNLLRFIRDGGKRQ